ncbi:ARM repeat-containing protein [Glarea lozoyensis ATCC 20868]|uniref:ARM repeat-containing protein n=2 Tax=Glarea lozoyensis TaxID=101852 RepID=S3DK26_GLAL2|nr:ARM repeat-containing protein [Glarea lozoyensis ATCC 20868]EPE26893.1 ARM repeat-containing protein [Glarea lozoyensis ATCC 20868]
MPPPNKLKLPKQLIEQLGGEDALSRKRKGGSGGGRPTARKDLRKAARAEKKELRSGPPPAKRSKIQHHRDSAPRSEAPSKRESNYRPAEQHSKSSIEAKPKSILKTTKKRDPVPRQDSRSISPPPRRVPQIVKDKLADEDAEIAALEKKLGLKGKKKKPGGFDEDGLDDLLGDLDEAEDEDVVEKEKAKAEGDEWLEKKRKEARERGSARNLAKISEVRNDIDNSDSNSDDSEGDDDISGLSEISLDADEDLFPDDDSGDGSVDEDTGDVLFSDANESDASGGFDESEEEGELENPTQRVRENPYVAPTNGGEKPQKYIPPSLRKPAASESESLTRLRRQTQGLVNRLTEANLISILGEIENLYRQNARQHVTSTLVDLLLNSVCEPTSLPDTLIILPAGFIAAVYKIIGMDFGAQVVQRVVELFDEHYERASATPESSKETSNLVMLLSELYNFQVIGSNLIYDYFKLFLGKLSELNAELLLKIIRASGPQLRQDDPSSLKDIVAMLRPAITSAGGEENMSVRTKFMIETINDLKNNKMRTGQAASAVNSEHTIRMKKTLGTLNTRSIKASEPLRMGLKDIKDSDKKGKWWLVGASWAGNSTNDKTPGDSHISNTAQVEDSGTSDLLVLAREQRMNTDVRRAIFITIMSATDFQDAYLKLLKLKLKKVQEYEIPKVLIRCSGAEKSYNPYYTLIAKKTCGDRRLKTAFQFCLWDLFKKLGEGDEDVDDVDEDEEIDMRHIVNLAKMFGNLIAENCLNLTALKNLNLAYLQPKTKTFIEVLLVTVLLQSQKSAKGNDEQAVISLISKVKDTPSLITGLQYFLRKVVGKTDIAGGKEQKLTVKWACKVAREALEAMAAMDTVKF